jgi:hypothetical protein
MKEGIIRKKRKPSQEPSTPETAVIILKGDFYVIDITRLFW